MVDVDVRMQMLYAKGTDGAFKLAEELDDKPFSTHDMAKAVIDAVYDDIYEKGRADAQK